MKIMGMIFVFLGCSGIGLTYSYMYKVRLQQLAQWKQGLIYLRNEINFALTPLGEAFEVVARRLKGELQPFFELVSNLLKDESQRALKKMNEETLEKALSDTCLNKKDMASILAFVKGLGLMDKDSQISNIELQLSNLTEELEKAQKDEEKNYKLYKTLGVLAGVFIVVLFI